VQKESAAIRASFREESHNSDLRYVTLEQSTPAVCADTILQEEQCRKTTIPVHAW
jgi:hypothetical protein